MRRRAFGCLLLVAMVAFSPAVAQPDKPWKSWFGHFGIGYSFPQSELGDLVDDDWNLVGGATYWPETWPLGIQMELSWNDFDLSGQTIRRINEILEDVGQSGRINGGDVEIWGLTADAVWSLPTQGSVGFDLMAGPGVYYFDAQVTTTGLVYYPPWCDWRWCYPGGVGPGTIVVGSQSSTEFGWNAGAAINFEMASGSEIYLEVKYDSIQADGGPADYVPFVVGYRW